MARNVLLSLTLPVVAILGYGLGTMPKGTNAREAAAAAHPGEARAQYGTRARPSPARPAAARAVAARAPGEAPVGTVATAEPEELERDEAAPEAPERQTFEQIRERQVREIAALHAKLDGRFEAQGVDPSWRRRAETQIADAVPLLGASNVRLEDSDCRSDICKSSIRHDEAGLDPEQLSAFIRSSGRGLEHYFKYEPGRLTVYSIRRDEP